MAKHLLENAAAEQEANDIGARYMNSSDVLSDMIRDYGGALNGVKVHDDAAADAKVRAVGRDGLASGKDVYMREGSLSSGDPAANGLLAHELTHVMQQDGGMQESVDYGEAQGGLISWFKSKFGRKKKEPADLAGASQAALGEVKTDNAGSVDKENLQSLVDMKADLVGASNEAFAGAANEKKAYQVSKGLQALDLRNISTTAGKIALAEQNRVFSSEGAYKDYFVGMDRRGVDWAKMDEGMLKGVSYGDKQTQINDASTQVTGGLLDIVGQYATSEGGLDLIQGLLDSTEGADVFKGTGTDALNYALQTILTTESLKARQAYHMNTGEFQDKGNEANDKRSDLITAAYKNMMVAPVLAMKSEEELNAMGIPPQMRTLLAQYQELRQKIEAGLAARKEATTGAAAPAPAPAPASAPAQQTPSVSGQKPKSLMSYQSDEVGDLVQRFKKNEVDLDPTSDDPKVMAAWSRIYYDKIKQLQKSGASKEEIQEAVRMFQEARQRQGTGSFR